MNPHALALGIELQPRERADGAYIGREGARVEADLARTLLGHLRIRRPIRLKLIGSDAARESRLRPMSSHWQPGQSDGQPSRRGSARMTLDAKTRWYALIVLCAGTLMIVLDSTIVNVALPSIRADLGFSETSLAWVVNAYLLTFGGFLLLGGRLGDLYGHRRLFLAGIALFTAASLACGLVHDAGAADHRARRAGRGRRRRIGRVAVADHEPLHRAGRSRQGDGRVRLRRLRRRLHRRAARRRAHRRARLALDLPRQHPDRRRRRAALSLRLLPGGQRP